jgi:hypothetical protein
MRGKLGPDHTIILKVYFYTNQECQINHMINISFRGGKPYQIPFSVSCIIPQVKILEPFFDFGSITTLEQSGMLQMTI